MDEKRDVEKCRILAQENKEKGTKYCNMKTQVLPTTFAEKQKRRKYQIRKRRMLVIAVGVLMGCSIYLLGSKMAGEKRLWMPFGYGAANVLSGSMEPTFSEGTLLIIKEAKETKPGEIVVYQAGEELIVHRVVAIDGDKIIAKGDANRSCDEPFDKSALKGRVIGWIPHIGAISNIVENIILLLAGLILTAWCLRRGRHKKT